LSLAYFPNNMDNGKILRTLFVYNGLFVLAGSLLGPLYAVYAGKFAGISISLSWSAFLFSTTFFNFILTRYGDVIKDRRYLLLAGMAIRSIVWFCFIFIETAFSLILLQVILGIGEALGGPSFDSILARNVDEEKMVKQYSIWKFVANLMTAGGTLVGGLIANKYGFQVLFLAMSFLAAVSFFGMLFRFKPVEAEADKA
jgi:MFS family permease